MNRSFVSLLCLLAILVFEIACNRDLLSPDPDARPRFSTDTISFDTVFTTIGSTTLNFRIYNHNNRPLLISSIRLAGGETSFFRLNIDGEVIASIQDVEIPPDDSLFVFVAVTVDPTNTNNPVIIKDSVIFNTNGFIQDIKLIAYGQDVHLFNNEVIKTQTWTNDKPYLIYKSLAVDSGQTLTIEGGTRIFFHKNASLIIRGRILVNGGPENTVVFQNDRLEEFYDVIPGQWGTIFIDPISRGNRINHAIIKNAIAGIQIGYPSDYHVPELELSNSRILNVSFAGIYAFGADITCFNTVIADCAGAAAALLRGGNYRFMHCTISNKGVPGTSRSSPSIVLSNTFNVPVFNESSGDYDYVRVAGDLEAAEFINCIIYGNFTHELQLVNNRTHLFNFRFDHSLMKAVEDSIVNVGGGIYNALILNKDPFFKNDSDRYHPDYSLDTLSPAKDAGDPLLLISYPYLEMDINGNLRTIDNKPDLGAFERKED